MDVLSLSLSSVPSIASDEISLLSMSTATEASSRDKITSAVLTIFPPTEDRHWLIPSTYFDEDHIEQWCAQFEEGSETERMHAHIFVKFKRRNRVRFDSLRKLITERVGSPGDIQKTKKSTKKSIQCAINYCLKPDTRKGESYIWNNSCFFDEATWLARKPNKSKQSKEDLERSRIDWIESKPKTWSWEQLVHECDDSKYLLASCGWGKSYHTGRMATVERRSISDVVILYGAGGTGKTTLAQLWDSRAHEDRDERYYKRNHEDGHFWGGGRVAYRGQRIIHFEEFSGTELFSNIKEWCDIGKPGPPVNVKNGGTHLNHEVSLFTTNVHPAGWYTHMWSKDPKQFHPFWRRVTKVWFFPTHRPDGSDNIPDDDNPPHYIDQTEDWKALKGDFSLALKHASKHWPIQDDEPCITDSRGARLTSFTWP